jgi:cellulose synthase operon protein C
LRAMAGDVAGASAAFAQTRSLAIGGAPDPLGLAVASYGEEARVHLDRAHGLLKDGGLPEADRHDYADEIEVAVELYAAQAARGSRIAVDSLRMVAEELADPGQPPAATEPAKLRAAIARPIVQRLLVAYALAQGDADLDSNKLLPQLVDAIQDAGGGPPAAADRLAALCYRIGRFDMAAQLAASASGPLAAWVKAKLALQQGDTAAAAADYAEASRAFPDAAASSLDDANIKLIAGERATLALARGGYVDAMAQLYPVAATYWGDVAHIAERVLTVDELKQFVDARVAAPLVPKTKAEPSDDFETWLAPEPAAQLRDLLARRLMREGRFKEAQAYFHAAADPNFDDHDVARQAAQYALALHDSTSRWWQADRARAWYAAAKLARWSGMAMLGYEGPPDYFGLHGDYDTGIGQAKLDGALVTSGEKARFAAAAARPDLRFHYRFIAVDDAIHAADRLPPRSQAFAAVLCQATGWMLSTTDKLDTEDWPRTKQNEADRQVTALYRRYVQQGAYVPWAAHFGHGCPEPDFDAAARFDREQLLRDMRHFASRYRWGLGLGLIGLLGAAIAWLAVRLRAAS